MRAFTVLVMIAGLLFLPHFADAIDCWDADGDGFQDVRCGGDDCGDDDPMVYPGAYERCNGIDDDCDCTVPGNEKDLDGDGYRICPGGGDCADDPADDPPECETCRCASVEPCPCARCRYVAAPESCDGVDNDCDGEVDENADADGDGYTVCGTPPDCNDLRADIHPGAPEVCDGGVDEDCDGLVDCLDVEDCPCCDWDGDGFLPAWCGGTDCDDDDPDLNPDAAERCNGIDDDCDGTVDEDVDDDGDGYTVCGDPADCDDGNDTVHPGANEICYDGLDNDCDGLADIYDVMDCLCPDADGDGFSAEFCGGDDCDDAIPIIYPGADEICNCLDDDCDGEVDEDFDVDGDEWRTCDGDCDDNDPLVYPGAPEVCNGRDDDCDGVVPANEADYDGDGSRICGHDCDDTDPNICPACPEICDGIDNDCDGEVDEDFDVDGDGFRVCDDPPDCNDADANVYPGAFEVCDNQDNDCDGHIDEGHDEDGDGWTWCTGDCRDNDPDVHPGVREGEDQGNCDDGVDNDCDGYVDWNDPDCPPPCEDLDGDEYINADCPYGDDCDDTNPQVYPGANEICTNGIDDDCDTLIDCDDEECIPLDADADGYLPPPCGGDCDDADPFTYPHADEICDGKDNNCDGVVDEGCGVCFIGSVM